jgi:hypothetical protein
LHVDNFSFDPAASSRVQWNFIISRFGRIVKEERFMRTRKHLLTKDFRKWHSLILKSYWERFPSESDAMTASMMLDIPDFSQAFACK